MFLVDIFYFALHKEKEHEETLVVILLCFFAVFYHLLSILKYVRKVLKCNAKS